MYIAIIDPEFKKTFFFLSVFYKKDSEIYFPKIIAPWKIKSALPVYLFV